MSRENISSVDMAVVVLKDVIDNVGGIFAKVLKSDIDINEYRSLTHLYIK